MRRRFGSKAALARAVIGSLRIAEIPAAAGPPRARALAMLENFHHNLLRRDAMALVGTLLAEEHRHPELLQAFRARLAGPRRALLRQALSDGIKAGELPPSTDPEAIASMLIGSFYARYIATSDLPDDWAQRVLSPLWPDQH
ncbi:MAG: TetR-like C-terminal domain-containing protein [Streptosporangiaceae bacterium]